MNWIAWRKLSKSNRCGGKDGEAQSCGVAWSPTHGNDDVETVRESNSDVRVSTLANPDDFDLLTTQWMIGMSNGHRLGRLF
jgi:hypothetical protein